MTDTLWPDLSEFNRYFVSGLGYRGVAIRSNDGTYRDRHFNLNIANAKHACDVGELDFFLVYFVFEDNWQATVQTFIEMVGKPHPKMAVMIDAESWAGKIRGDHSKQLNAARAAVAKYLGKYMSLRARVLLKHRKRVGGYANAGDFAALWPTRSKGMWVVLANYSSNPKFPGKLAHQFSDKYAVAGLGKVDMNSADGKTPAQVVKVLGLDPTPSVKPKPKPKPAPKPPKKKPVARHRRVYVVHQGDTFIKIAAHFRVKLAALIKANPKIKNPALIFPGETVYIP